MAIERVFLGWEKPALQSAAEQLFEWSASSEAFDLSAFIVAVPGGRAGRRLLELLVLKAEEHRTVLFPPEIVTVGRLPELLYRVKKPFACEFTQQLAWHKALEQMGADRLKTLTARLPPNEDLPARLSLARVLSRLHRELAAENLDFKDVAKECAAIKAFPEEKRWKALAGIQRLYLDTLSKLGLWDCQTARRFAIEEKECALEKELVLAGTADLNRQHRLMLDQVAKRVTAMIFAPEEIESRFDRYGCIIPEAWSKESIPLMREQIRIADDPADQAARTVQALAGLDGRYAAGEISLGVPDEEVVPFLQQILEQNKIANRYGVGMPLSRSRPHRLLKATADYLEGKRFESFAALIRHPDVHSWLEAKGIEGDWLSILDDYHEECFPFLMDGAWLKKTKGFGLVKEVHEAMDKLLAPFRGADKPLRQWNDAILGLLVELFGPSPLDPNLESDHALLSVCEKIQEELNRILAMPEGLEPEVKGAQALRLLLSRVQSENIPPPQQQDAVELLGWLELSMDDAPVLIVTGFNEGMVPSSLNADLFLPNQLRRSLKIEDNERRFARDAYALSVLAASRKELVVVAGRRRANSDPLHPGRLLFACPQEDAARRALDFFAALKRPSTGEHWEGSPKRRLKTQRLEVPRPEKLPGPVTSMRVTEFRDYIDCPYRYYLRHRLGLEALADDSQELDGRGFGLLAHDVLRDFGRSRLAVSKNPEKIRAWLDEALDRTARARFGKNVLAAVRLQIEQMRFRLHDFAEKQAQWVEEGWRIEHVEVSPKKDNARLMVDRKPMILKGRIDRIDRHVDTGTRRILDYKTSGRPMSPEKAHRLRGEWIDLQLPLYRHLARSLGLEGELELGFITLSQERPGADCLIAQWNSSDLEAADRCAEEVVRNIRGEKFWPPNPSPRGFFADLSAICQDGHFAALRSLAREEEGGDS
ncbi:MAG: PD-(D/E)XK nuclease family protein [Planctomycetota bacterium]|jgi:hypothetical protein